MPCTFGSEDLLRLLVKAGPLLSSLGVGAQIAMVYVIRVEGMTMQSTLDL